MAIKGIKFNGTTIDIPQEYLKSVVVGKGTITFTDQSGNKIEFIQEKVEIDKELSVDSAKPVENKAIALAINESNASVDSAKNELNKTKAKVDELESRTADENTVGGIRIWSDDTTLYISTVLYDNKVVDGTLKIYGAYATEQVGSNIKVG